VLDRHVLDYMAAVDIYCEESGNVSRLAGYGRHEAALRSYAERIGFAVGLLDWAIWIVMRAARQIDMEPAGP
jgi:N-glycosylase/DNA lyase